MRRSICGYVGCDIEQRDGYNCGMEQFMLACDSTGSRILLTGDRRMCENCCMGCHAKSVICTLHDTRGSSDLRNVLLGQKLRTVDLGLILSRGRAMGYRDVVRVEVMLQICFDS